MSASFPYLSQTILPKHIKVFKDSSRTILLCGQSGLLTHICKLFWARSCFDNTMSCYRDVPTVTCQGHCQPIQCTSVSTGYLRVLASGQLDTIWMVVLLAPFPNITINLFLSLNRSNTNMVAQAMHRLKLVLVSPSY
jgi:hypothetical protein